MAKASTLPAEKVDLLEEQVVDGYRLDYFEAYNWGTFHERVGRARLDGQTTLLTGENGAGKSTLADGIVTLLVPTNKRNYNAASSEQKRERSEPDYIRGNTGRAYNETTERDEPVFLRPDGQYYTVLLGVFRNRRTQKVVSLAQVLWIKANGDTGKIFLVEDRPLTIEGDLAGFPSIGEIKEQLGLRGFTPLDKFTIYSERFHRLMRLNAERLPMDIFNQTVAVKDIKNLTDFIRDYMLEGGSAEGLFTALKERVAELRATHAKIKMLKDQLVKLETISAHVSTYRSAGELRTLLEKQHSALDAFFAKTALTLRLLRSTENNDRIQKLTELKNRLQQEVETTRAALDALKAKQKNSAQGGQIAALDNEIEALNRTAEMIERNRTQFDRLIQNIFPNRVIESASAFATISAQLPPLAATLKTQAPGLGSTEKDLDRKWTGLKEEQARIELEIRRTIHQHTLIDGDALERRDRIADALNIPRKELPFTGELLRVRDSESRWTGAIESLLRGFALTILVRDQDYRAVDAFVTANKMRGRIEYIPVPAEVPAPGPKPDIGCVAGKVELKPDIGIFGRYIQRELNRRFDHVCCEATDARWHGVEQALTVTGLYKGRSGRRVKDDGRDINDRHHWNLGWDNHDKVTALKTRQKELEQQAAKAEKEFHNASTTRVGHENRLRAVEALVEAAFTYEEISVADIKATIAAKAALRDGLKKDPAMAQLSASIATASQDLKGKNTAHLKAHGDLTVAESEEEKNLTEIERLRGLTLNQPPELEDVFILIGRRSAQPVTNLDALADHKAKLDRDYTREIADQKIAVETNAAAAIAKMTEMIHHPDWGHLHDEIGSTPPASLSDEVIGRFQRVEVRIRKDDIPKNEDKFKRLLQENVISDFNTFRTSLHEMEQDIVDRIATINEHLSKVDFDRRENQKTYIKLVPEKTRDQVVRDFRVQLNNALKDILNIDEDIEARTNVFHQVNALIEDLDKDAKRRAHVIDVRNWFDFKADERWRTTDKTKEVYQGAIGKSGGEKSRLASTILATAIAYQYDIEIDRPEGDTFRFVLIDEALSRIGDEFSAYLFEVFSRFHLQLLIIHPRDAKLHITERFVRRYNVALKPGRFSSVVSMTVHEFQDYKKRFTGA